MTCSQHLRSLPAQNELPESGESTLLNCTPKVQNFQKYQRVLQAASRNETF